MKMTKNSKYGASVPISPSLSARRRVPAPAARPVPGRFPRLSGRPRRPAWIYFPPSTRPGAALSPLPLKRAQRTHAARRRAWPRVIRGSRRNVPQAARRVRAAPGRQRRHQPRPPRRRGTHRRWGAQRPDGRGDPGGRPAGAAVAGQAADGRRGVPAAQAAGLPARQPARPARNPAGALAGPAARPADRWLAPDGADPDRRPGARPRGAAVPRRPPRTAGHRDRAADHADGDR